MNIFWKVSGPFRLNVNSIDKNDKYENQTLKGVVGWYRLHENNQHRDTESRFDKKFSRKRVHDTHNDENQDPKRKELNVSLQNSSRKRARDSYEVEPRVEEAAI